MKDTLDGGNASSVSGTSSCTDGRSSVTSVGVCASFGGSSANSLFSFVHRHEGHGHAEGSVGDVFRCRGDNTDELNVSAVVLDTRTHDISNNDAGFANEATSREARTFDSKIVATLETTDSGTNFADYS